MEKKFKTGDVVRLKSGGPKMTVVRYRSVSTDVICNYYDGNELKTSVHEQTALELVDTNLN